MILYGVADVVSDSEDDGDEERVYIELFNEVDDYTLIWVVTCFKTNNMNVAHHIGSVYALDIIVGIVLIRCKFWL